MNEEQYMFDRTLSGLGVAFRYAVRLFLFSPLVFLAIIITTNWLSWDEMAKLTGGIYIALVSFALYGIVFFLKGVMMGLKLQGNYFWIPLFLLLIGITCVPLVYMVFEPMGKLLVYLDHEKAHPVLQWCLSLIVGYVGYLKYQFLTDIAPNHVSGLYLLGVRLTAIRLRR